MGHLALARQGKRRWKEERTKGICSGRRICSTWTDISTRSGDQKRARAFDASVILQDPRRQDVSEQKRVRMTITLGRNKELWRKNFIPAPYDTISHSFHFFDFARSFLPPSLACERKAILASELRDVANKHSRRNLFHCSSWVYLRDLRIIQYTKRKEKLPSVFCLISGNMKLLQTRFQLNVTIS